MLSIQATIKIPEEYQEQMMKELNRLNITDVNIRTISFEQFESESRLNYDCVFDEAWEKKEPVTYLDFFFEDSVYGRQSAFAVEYNLKQIPLNLRYVEKKGHSK